MGERESRRTLHSYLPAFLGPMAGAGFAIAGLLNACAPIAQAPKAAAAPVAEAAAKAPDPGPPPAPPASLASRLEALAESYGEPVGIAVAAVDEGWVAATDEGLYPQQSVSKLWVAITVLDAVDRGRLTLDGPVVMQPLDRSVFYQPVARHIGPGGYVTSVRDLLARAIIESDNAANDRLIREAGGVDVVTATLAAKGVQDIRIGAEERDLQSRIAGLDRWKPEYGYGQAFKLARAALPDHVREAAEDAYLQDPYDGASPAAIARGLVRLHRGELLSPASTQLLIGLMAQAKTGPKRLKAGLPGGWSLAHKTGTGPDGRRGSVGINDVGLATGPDGKTYAVAVLMRRTAKPVPARLAFMQKVSRELARWHAGQG